MLDGVLDLIPTAKISVVGLQRDEETLKPISYFEKFVDSMDERPALIIDLCWRQAVRWWYHRPVEKVAATSKP